MKLYDVRVPIHETPDGCPAIDETIEKLDEMLTQYGIDHYFALPTNAEMEADEKPLIYYLFYCLEKDVEVTLIISLYLRMYLNKNKENILEGITKSLGRNEVAA